MDNSPELRTATHSPELAIATQTENASGAYVELLQLDRLEQGDTLELPYYVKRALANKQGATPTDKVLVVEVHKPSTQQSWDSELKLGCAGKFYMEWDFTAAPEPHIVCMSVGVPRTMRHAYLIEFRLTKEFLREAKASWEMQLDARAHAQRLKNEREGVKPAKPAKAKRGRKATPSIDINTLLGGSNDPSAIADI